MTADLIHRLWDGPKVWKLTSTSHESPSFTIEDHLRQEATLAVPVHAEIQLLIHYERNSCNLPPRIICSSKQACFFCNLFFKIHGRFVIPSTYGRFYKKWALPEAAKNVGSADADSLNTWGRFVSAIKNALLREIQPSRKSYPDPHNQLTTSSHSSSASQRHVWCQDPISAPKNDTLSRTGSPIPYAAKSATTSAI